MLHYRWFVTPALGIALVHLGPGCGGGEVIVGGEGGEAATSGSTSRSSSSATKSSSTATATATSTTATSTTATSTTATSTTATSTTASTVSVTTAASSSSTGMSTPDSCNDVTLPLAPGEGYSLQGSTIGLQNDFATNCADPGGTTADAVFTVTMAQDCVITAELLSQGFDAGVAAFPSCAAPAFGCSNSGVSTDLIYAFFPANTYGFVIDGVTGTEGNFVFNIACDAPRCGDGLVSGAEECDVGPAMPMDGCGDPGTPNECKFETVNAGVENCADANAGEAVSINGGQVIQIPPTAPYRTTIGAVDDSASVSPCPGIAPGGRDHVYRVVPTANGILTARVGETESGNPFCDAGQPAAGCWDRLLYAKEGNCTSGPQLDCSDDLLDGGAVEEISFPVSAGENYYVFVDGPDASAVSQGLYVLRLELN